MVPAPLDYATPAPARESGAVRFTRFFLAVIAVILGLIFIGLLMLTAL
jgi:hypothetical protein